MKRCPECRRDYYDDTLSFCLEDGTPLVQGSVPVGQVSADEPATAILSEPEASAGGSPPSESPTKPQINTRNQTAILPTGIAEPQSKRNLSGGKLAALIGLIAVLGAGGF
ncbi:MAG: hypothetical protein H0X08_06255, partial [Blastocatellia bacterium]|nr:hypothetical protein [Blastocatellia bacterium]